MGKIFCIMGKSCSGKDSISKALSQDIELNLISIIPYSTRPRRANEENGVDYHFISKKTLNSLTSEGKVIESRHYNTVHGVWYYCTINDGQIDLSRGDYLIIATLEGYKNLVDYFGTNSVIPVYISVNDATRLERAINREKNQKNQNYDELCRRFLADNVDFTQARINELGITKVYQNEVLEVCLNHIKNDILQTIKQCQPESEACL